MGEAGTKDTFIFQLLLDTRVDPSAGGGDYQKGLHLLTEATSE